MAAASFFEMRIQTIIRNFIAKTSQNNPIITSLVEEKVISRQYHTYFDWRESNANKFFTLFGKDFKTQFQDVINKDMLLEEGVKAFLELGNLRNALIHQNFASYTVNKTGTEVYGMYKKAESFVNAFEIHLLSRALPPIPKPSS